MPDPLQAPSEESDAAQCDDDLLTYDETAVRLHLSRGRIADLVSKDILHPVKLPGSRHKFLRRQEVDWYDRRRQGSAEPNPIPEVAPLPASALPGISHDAFVSGASSAQGAALEQVGAVVAGVLLVAFRGLPAVFPEGSPQRAQLNAMLLGAIRELRATAAGRAVLAGLASQIAGLLARGDAPLPASEQARLRDLLNLLTSPTPPAVERPRED